MGTNRYAYSFNDPINKMDPSGNATVYNDDGTFTHYDPDSGEMTGTTGGGSDEVNNGYIVVAQARPATARRGHNGGPPLDPIVSGQARALQEQILAAQKSLGLPESSWIGTPTNESNRRLRFQLDQLRSELNEAQGVQLPAISLGRDGYPPNNGALAGGKLV